jgi:hypothetical protein
MPAISIALRRTFFLLTVAVAVAATASWWRRRSATPTPTAPPEWPSLTPVPDVPMPAAATTETRSDTADAGWVSPDADGSAPASHPIKAKENSGIFHVPGGRFYDRTKADRCYATAAAAEADGYRQSKT